MTEFMKALSHRTCLIIKLSYVLIGSVFFIDFINEAYSCSFKFIISSIGIVTFFSLFLCSVLQKGFSIVYFSILVFGMLYIFNLVFIVSSVINTDVGVLSLDNLSYVSSVVYMVMLSGLLYLIIHKCLCFTSPAEKRILRLFLAFLISLIVVEKIISLSLPAISNIILGLIFMFIISEYLTISVKSYYSERQED